MYYLIFGLFYLVSLLPFRVLYLFSDLAYFIIYRVMGYRKEVVMQNLTIAFPQKTEAEKEVIARQFYRNFTDTFIETIKFMSASQASINKRFEGDFSVVNELHKSGRSIQIHLGHNFNWELANLAVAPSLPGKVLGVYLRINNRVFDRLFRYIRSRFGSQLISAIHMREEMLPHRGTQYTLGLIADQSPGNIGKAQWVNFFGRPTAFMKAPESAARRNDLPVVFCHFTKPKRGYYKAHVELAVDHSAALPDGELTKHYAAFLERVMSQHPEVWLWSHRRWKHEWKPEYGEVK
jgi:KDO2-lipid IV(A) lauroyltransferase